MRAAERDDFHQIVVPFFSLSMIFFREVLPTFRDHALGFAAGHAPE
jgi:hypothetical protein